VVKWQKSKEIFKELVPLQKFNNNIIYMLNSGETRNFLFNPINDIIKLLNNKNIEKM